MRGWEKLFGGLSMATPASTLSHSTSTSSRTLRALRSQRCDFADLVHPRRRSGYSVTAFPAQNGFCTRPVATDSCRCRLGPVRARRPLCLLGCASSVASLVSAEYPSTKQLLNSTEFAHAETPTRHHARTPTHEESTDRRWGGLHPGLVGCEAGLVVSSWIPSQDVHRPSASYGCGHAVMWTEGGNPHSERPSGHVQPSTHPDLHSRTERVRRSDYASCCSTCSLGVQPVSSRNVCEKAEGERKPTA